MKRSYSDIATKLTQIPQMTPDDPRMFKSTLEGDHVLKIVDVVDISKPRDKPAEAIDEPEEEETIRINQMNKTNARMFQLDLRDSRGSKIKAIETERINMLNDIKPGIIQISGPIEIRCGNLMLKKEHVLGIQIEQVADSPPLVQVCEDWDENEEDEDCIIIE